MELVRRRMDGVLSPTCTVPGRKIKRGWCRMNAGQAQDQRQAECSPGSEESLKNRSTKQEGRRQRYPGQTDRCFLCWRWLTAVAAGYCLAASTHSLRCPAFQWVNWHSDEPRHTDTHVQGRGHVSAPLPSPPLTPYCCSSSPLEQYRTALHREQRSSETPPVSGPLRHTRQQFSDVTTTPG